MTNDNTKRVTCATKNCGTFVMDESLYNKLQRTGETFHCPEGHAQHFTESTESKLRDRIWNLHDKIEREERRRKNARQGCRRAQQEAKDERRRRKAIQQAILPAINGVIEVQEDMWLWGCACGGSARTVFGSEAKARNGLRQHREKSCDGGVSERIEAIQNAAKVALNE